MRKAGDISAKLHDLIDGMESPINAITVDKCFINAPGTVG